MTTSTPTDRTIPLLPAQRTVTEHGVAWRWHCRVCNREHESASLGFTEGDHCDLLDSPYRATGVILYPVEVIRPPVHRYRIRYTNRGEMVSGYLRQRERMIERRAAEVPTG